MKRREAKVRRASKSYRVYALFIILRHSTPFMQCKVSHDAAQTRVTLIHEINGPTLT
jgi:hypothetical protein